MPPCLPVKAELFPTEIRALGVGLPYALTVSIFGGTAEYIALWFKSIGMETGYYWYVTACIAVSLLNTECQLPTVSTEPPLSRGLGEEVAQGRAKRTGQHKRHPEQQHRRNLREVFERHHGRNGRTDQQRASGKPKPRIVRQEIAQCGAQGVGKHLPPNE